MSIFCLYYCKPENKKKQCNYFEFIGCPCKLLTFPNILNINCVSLLKSEAKVYFTKQVSSQKDFALLHYHLNLFALAS